MKTELKLTSDQATDSPKLEAALRADDLVFALKKVYESAEDNVIYATKVQDILQSLGVWHFIND